MTSVSRSRFGCLTSGWPTGMIIKIATHSFRSFCIHMDMVEINLIMNPLKGLKHAFVYSLAINVCAGMETHIPYRVLNKCTTVIVAEVATLLHVYTA